MEKIRLNQLEVGYGRRNVAGPFTATLSDSSLTCLIGANGVGKSTLLRTLTGYQSPLAGSVEYFCGQWTALQNLTSHQLARLVAIVLTERTDARRLTAQEVVAMGRSPYTGFWGTGSADDHRIVADCLHMVGIEALAHRRLGTLSDGERQKVMIARALAQQTPVIFLDEPTAFLDYPSRVEVMTLLRQLAHEQGKTLVLSTHDLELAVRMADCIWLMERQQPLVIGTPAQLLADGSLSRYAKSPLDAYFEQRLNP